MALQRGCDVYVGYCFGQTKLYHCWYDKSGKMRRWSRKWGTGFLPVWGRYVGRDANSPKIKRKKTFVYRSILSSST